MSNLSKQTSTAAFRAWKAGVLFDFLDTNKDGKLEINDFLEFPRNLERTGRTDVASKIKTLYLKYWSLLNESLGRTDLHSFGKEEFSKAVAITTDHDWYRNTFVVGVAEGYFQSIDLNQNGYISTEDWRQYQNSRGMTDEAVIKAMFAKLDTDGDGKISPDEVRQAYTMFGLSDDPAEDYSFIYTSSLQ